MIVDTSALVAIIADEPDVLVFASCLVDAEVARMSAATYLEVAIVIDARRNPRLSRRMDEFIRDAAAVIEPVTEAQARIAREAYRDYGKGSGHAAGLNFGDCFAYALARDKMEPLLYKGDDFSRTDIRPALPQE